jgi:enoyl-CoA hydratase/carnithine racemase
LVVDGGRATLSFNRPESRNAIDGRGWSAIAAALTTLERATDCRVLVVRGSDNSFSSGADLAEISALRADPDELRSFYTQLRTALELLWRLPVPTIAAIDGHCHGAGLSIAVACDIRVATSRSTFVAAPARLGLLYSRPELARLLALIGPGPCRDLLFTARTVHAEEAHRIGLVQRLTATEAFEDSLASVVGAIERLSQQSHRSHKRALLALSPVSLDDGAAEDAFFGSDAEVAFAALAGARRPDFSGGATR